MFYSNGVLKKDKFTVFPIRMTHLPYSLRAKHSQHSSKIIRADGKKRKNHLNGYFGQFDSGNRVKCDITFEWIGSQPHRGAFLIGATSSMISWMDDSKWVPRILLPLRTFYKWLYFWYFFLTTLQTDDVRSIDTILDRSWRSDKIWANSLAVWK